MPSHNKILIISDMFGTYIDGHKQDDYLQKTTVFFEKLGYQPTILSSLQLAGISCSETNLIHSEFVKHGLESSVVTLCQDHDNFDAAIGFSIGGTILYQAIQRKPSLAKKLICISATRLRYETLQAPCPMKVIFGEKDVYAPTLQWSQSVQCDFRLISNAEHDFYRTEQLQYILLQEERFLKL